jgi:hypothetical protein
MRYTVLWVPRAEQELADIWTNAADRDAVTRAAHEIDQRLQRDAPNQGDSRPAGRRILFVPPLGVIFKVEELDRIARVYHVWRYP